MRLALRTVFSVSSTISSIVSAGSTACGPAPRGPPELDQTVLGEPIAPARTVAGDTDTARAIAVFATPSAAISNARARCTSRCGADCDRANDSNTSRCPSVIANAGTGLLILEIIPIHYQLFGGHTTSTVVGDLSAEIRRSAWRVDTGYTNPVEELSEALAEQGAEWPLLKAGLFGGSVERANEALSIYAETFANRARETSLPLERTSTTFTCREAAQRAHLPRRAVKGLSLVLFEPPGPAGVPPSEDQSRAARPRKSSSGRRDRQQPEGVGDHHV